MWVRELVALGGCRRCSGTAGTVRAGGVRPPRDHCRGRARARARGHAGETGTTTAMPHLVLLVCSESVPLTLLVLFLQLPLPSHCCRCRCWEWRRVQSFLRGRFVNSAVWRGQLDEQEQLALVYPSAGRYNRCAVLLSSPSLSHVPFSCRRLRALCDGLAGPASPFPLVAAVRRLAKQHGCYRCAAGEACWLACCTVLSVPTTFRWLSLPLALCPSPLPLPLASETPVWAIERCRTEQRGAQQLQGSSAMI